MSVFDIAFLGDSLTKDRNARNWPIHLEHYLQLGKSQRVKTYLFGQEGTNSNTGLTQYQPIVDLRPRVAVLSYVNDSNAAAISLATSLVNYDTIIDAIQAGSPNTSIYVSLVTRPRADAEASTFANMSGFRGQLAGLVTSQGLAGFIDCYTAWGDPASHPSEYDVGDGIHPLLEGYVRVTIPTFGAALSSLIS